ncbi:hypothetical protein ACLBKU_10600 [Erythrobacter sp. NE805]|uniref:hypothetical protein n=1 Tax=Erythrobacter sp. NE805 TaxID=3389875 RepID=UPI00396AFE59
MKGVVANLGRKPLTRRLVAAVVLIGAAIVTALLRSKGSQLLFDLVANTVVAFGALVVLHVRWRSREKRAISPEQAQDIFS